MNKRILIFLPDGIGGAERVGVTIGKMLISQGGDVKFVIIGNPRGSICDIIPSRTEVFYIPKNYVRWTKMTSLIRREKADIVFASCRNISRDIIWATKIPGLTCKVIVRSDNPLKTLKLWQRLLIRLSFRFADIVIAQQEEMRQEIVNEYPVPSRKVIALQNPIDYDDIRIKSQAPSPYPQVKAVNYLWAASIKESGTKGQDILLRAFAKVRQRNMNAHLYLVGRYVEGGAYYNGLKDFAERHHLTDYVHFIGYDVNPYRWMKYADCFVLSSRVEGLPNALVEAMYLKRPVVSSRCLPVIDRMIKDGMNGYKAEVGDVDGLAAAMEKAVTLGEPEMIYKPADNDEFLKLFELN